MKMYWFLSVCLFLSGLPLVACTPSGGPPAEPKAATLTSQAAGAPWEQKWASALAGGKKEATLTVYALSTGWAPATRTALTEAFRNKFGIDLTILVLGRGAEVAARVQREKAAGLSLADVIAIGSSSLIVDMKPAGLLGDLEPILLLPEVTDPKAWGGTMPFIDKDKKAVGTVIQVQRNVLYNTDLVRKREIASYKDLLKPQYKGKIITEDPATAGVANGMFAALALSVWNLEEVKDFVRQLIRQQEAVLSRDSRLIVETVAKGKHSIALAPSNAIVKQFLQAGATIDVATDLKEGTNANAASGSLAISATPPHPSATTVFVNWLLTKEAQTILSRTMDSPSMRTDVGTEGRDRRYVPQPGEMIVFENEEAIIFKGDKLRGILAEVIQQAGVK